ncbi:hypothetical protein N185_32330 [Sinorhizobium sp. GW3]|nr:hypothetical protein N185_32330 [Sinorhizobium sp. GW3]
MNKTSVTPRGTDSKDTDERMATKHDYIVVGSGINALVCAARLGQKGRRVLLLERNDRIGGCLRSEEITLPGFVHDVMAMTMVLFVTGPAYAALGEDLRRHGLEFCNSEWPHAVALPDGQHVRLSRNRKANIDALNALHPGDGDHYRSDVTRVEHNARLLFGLLGGKLWSLETLKLLLAETWRRRPTGVKAFVGEVLTPARSWLESGYGSQAVRSLLAPWPLHAGLGPEDVLSAEIGKVIAFSLEAAGAPIVKGGVRNLLSAFAALIEEQGGEIRVDSDVDGILRANGRAVGVRLSSGEIISAREGVICSVTPKQLHGRLLGNPENESDAVSKYRHGKGNFQIHYALDKPPAWKNPALAEVAVLHLTGGVDAVSKACNEALRGVLPERPTICVKQPHALDPSRCPPGKAVLWLQLPEAPSAVRGDAAGLLPAPAHGTWTEELREAYADRAEALLAAYIHDFRKTVLARRAYSPADLESLNINLVGGDPYGGSATIDQSLFWRPFKHSINHRTQVKGLYMIGASTHPGPGLGGGSGFLLAEQLKGHWNIGSEHWFIR